MALASVEQNEVLPISGPSPRLYAFLRFFLPPPRRTARQACTARLECPTRVSRRRARVYVLPARRVRALRFLLRGRLHRGARGGPAGAGGLRASDEVRSRPYAFFRASLPENTIRPCGSAPPLSACVLTLAVFWCTVRNHAYLMTGSTVQHTYLRAHMFEKACEVQVCVRRCSRHAPAPPRDPPQPEIHRVDPESGSTLRLL